MIVTHAVARIFEGVKLLVESHLYSEICYRTANFSGIFNLTGIKSSYSPPKDRTCITWFFYMYTDFNHDPHNSVQ